MRDDDPRWIELVKRDKIWAIAREYWLNNRAHEFPDDNRLMGCIESGCKEDMTDHCWMILKAQYST